MEGTGSSPLAFAFSMNLKEIELWFSEGLTGCAMKDNVSAIAFYCAFDFL
jgi:hypothetical protein